jgi:hypothetical protein
MPSEEDNRIDKYVEVGVAFHDMSDQHFYSAVIACHVRSRTVPVVHAGIKLPVVVTPKKRGFTVQVVLPTE